MPYPTAVRLCVVIATLFLHGCGPGDPVDFSRGEAITLGDWRVAVQRAESLSPSQIPQLEYAWPFDDDARLLAVHVLMDYQGESDRLRDISAEKFVKLVGAFWIEDREGTRYDVGLPFPERLFQVMKNPTSKLAQKRMFRITADDTRWVLLYGVPRDARGFSMYIRAKKARADEPRLARVNLGR